MSSVIGFSLALLSSYLIGAIPAGFILTKIIKGGDIREMGSTNIGATNVLRSVGRIPALITLVFDILKGVIAVTLIAGFLYSSFDIALDFEFYRAVLGIAVISGHIWNIFLKFKGGKGVATIIGVAAVISPLSLVLSLGVWLAVFLATNYVSLGSLLFGLSFPIISAILGRSIYTTIFGVISCFIITYTHRANISRLLKGGENKVKI